MCSSSYLAHGTATDYMYSVLKVPLSFTWEIFGDPDATFEDCFRMFNPLGAGKFKVGATGAGLSRRWLAPGVQTALHARAAPAWSPAPVQTA